MATKAKSTITNTTKEGIFAESIREYPDRLVVISEGDSWFSYPLNRNLADFLEMMGDFTMLRLEKNGDEARQMLAKSGSQYRKLGKFMTRYKKRLELLIFSGGGNDVLDENLPSLLLKMKPGMTWRDCINAEALAERLTQIRGAYENLLALRDTSAPDLQIVTHSYDYLVPDGRKAPVPLGLVTVGPWVKPVLKQFRIDDIEDGKAIIRHLIDAFHASIAALASPARRFHVVDTRGTLPAGTDHWADEIHPTGRGFEKLAEKWRPTLRGLFPLKGF